MLMLPIVASALLAANDAPDPNTAALALCRPRIEREVEGQIQTAQIVASQHTDGWTVIQGQTTVFLGMGKPPAGSASAHHLIRSNFDFTCWVRGGRVRKLAVTGGL